MATIYDPITKQWFGEEYASPEVKARGVEVGGMGVLPTMPTTTEQPMTEQLTPIEEQLKKIQTQIPDIKKEMKELSATNLIGEGITPSEIPYDQIKPDEKAITDIITGAGGTTELVNALLKSYEERLKTAEEEKKTWLEKLTAQPEKTREEREKELWEEFGVSETREKIAEQNIKVTNLQKQLDLLAVQRQEAEDKAYTRLAGMPFIRGEVGEINRKYNSERAYVAVELGAEAALLSAYRGNLEDAMTFVDRSMNAWMWDYTEEKNRLQFVYDYHKDWYDSLNADYKNIFNTALNLAIKKEDQAREDAQYILDLWTRAAENGVYLNYADMLKMGKEEAARIYAERVSATEGGLTKDQKDRIFNQINMQMDNYKTNPAGFRETLINALVAQYGEPARDYISKQVYAQLPDIGGAVLTRAIDEYVRLLSGGQISLFNVPSDIRTKVVDRAAETGQQIINPIFARASKEAVANYNTAMNLLDTLDKRVSDIFKSPNWVVSKVSGIGKWIGGKAGWDKMSNLYLSSTEAFLSMLTRAAGERGVLTNVDVGRLRKALPNLGMLGADTKDVAEAKMQSLRDLFAGIAQGTVDAYTAEKFGISLKEIQPSTEVLDYIKSLNLPQQ